MGNRSRGFTPVIRATLALVALLAAGPSRTADASAKVLGSLVQIEVQANPLDLVSPWQGTGVETGYGSGVILDGRRILTAAHVVADAVGIEVKREGTTKQYTASVQWIAHECDLAVLTVEDRSFFEGSSSLAIGDTPRLEDAVKVYGFPIGGDSVSVTSGIVSRVEISHYSHSWRQLLLVQIDAAINRGNSGGPVVSADGRLAGIAFQLIESAENVGYMIPAEVVSHFLRDIEDNGRYDGFPTLGVAGQAVTNDGLRKAYGLGSEQAGFLVTGINHGGSVYGVVRPEDVILAVDGTAVTEDLTMPHERLGRVQLEYLVQMKQVGEEMELTLLREGEAITRTVRLNNEPALVPGTYHESRGSYFIVGGLVFQPLTLDFLLNVPSSDDEDWFPGNLEYYALYKDRRTPRRNQVIVLSKVLSAAVNRGYGEWTNRIVDSVQGEVPRDMEHLVGIVEGSKEPLLKIVADSGDVLVLDLARAREEGEGILERHGVPADRSRDLL